MSGEIGDVGAALSGIESDYSDVAYETESVRHASEFGRTFDAQNIPMTPELILWIVGKQLTEMDRQIRTAMLDIEGTHGRSEEIGEQITALRELDTLLREDAASSNGKVDLDELNEDGSWEFRNSLQLDRHRDDDERMRAQFKQVLAGYGIHMAASDTSFDLSTIKNKIDNLTEEQRRINSGNEMKMMGLQNAMQQRSQAIQAGSNFLASIHDGAKTIVGNLR